MWIIFKYKNLQQSLKAKKKNYNSNSNKIYQYNFHDPFIKIYQNRGNLIMHEFYMNLSFKIFNKSENYFKIIYGVIIFWPLDMTLKIDVHSFWTLVMIKSKCPVFYKKKKRYAFFNDRPPNCTQIIWTDSNYSNCLVSWLFSAFSKWKLWLTPF